MGIFSESDSERAVREHNEGQEAGSKATALDKFAHRVWGNTGYSDAYNKGWDHGVNNPAPKDDYYSGDDDETYSGSASNDTSEKHKGGGDSTSSSGYSGSSSGSSSTSGSSGAGGLLLVVIAIVGVIILVMNGYNATNGRNNGKEVWVMMGVNTTMLNIRSGPGTDSSVIAKFERGARLATTGEPVVKGNEQWVRVSTDDGKIQGWANLKFLSASPQLQEQNISFDEQDGEAGNPNGEVPRQENDYATTGVTANDSSKLSREKCQELIDSVVLVNPDFTFSVRNVDIPSECTQQLNDKYRFLQEKTNERNKMLKERRRQM